MTVLALAVSFAASADTIAWWHFDERDPGTTAPAGTVASDQAPTTYAHVYTIGDNDSMTNLYENSGDYMPTYAKPFRGTAVYDPVSGIARTNNAAMKFRIDRGGSAPDSDKGRAHFGGALKFDGGKDLYQPLYGKSALTVEAFVCTTGGVYNLFAPIVGILGGTSFQSERFALYMRDDGSIAVRFATTANTDPTIWYTSDGRGKATVNDGACPNKIGVGSCLYNCRFKFLIGKSDTSAVQYSNLMEFLCALPMVLPIVTVSPIVTS